MNVNSFVPSNKIFDNMNLTNTDTKVNDASNASGDNLSFIDTLKEKLNDVNDKQIQSDQTTEAFIKGDDVDVHQVMLSAAEAKMSLQMAVQVRNKLVDAYQELNKMQV